jgi:peptidoglycan L-alanyl-D-glutamate endopeptidase CwlK
MPPSIDSLHPDLRAKVVKIMAAMELLGFPMMVVQTVRTAAEQQALYAQGRTAPGKIVTNCDGIVKKSNHQVHADGFGHAVDCAFKDDPATAKVETWDAGQPWELYGRMGEALDLTWGGRWISPFDRPHLEQR